MTFLIIPQIHPALSAIISLILITIIVVVLKERQRRQAALYPSDSESTIPPIKDRNFRDFTSPLARDTILVEKSSSVTGSYLGGAPTDVPGFTWPTFKGRSLSLLACIDCAELPRSADMNWLPAVGRLLFFYDMEEATWGLTAEDRGSFATLYLPEATAAAPLKFALPSLPLKSEFELPMSYVSFRIAKLPPCSLAYEIDAMKLTDEEEELFNEEREELKGDGPFHQIGGYPDAVQESYMELDCELTSTGIPWNHQSNNDDPQVISAKAAASGWSLLFQMDSDDDLNTLWGDAGMLYFWVRRDEARQLNFDNVWMILQCS